MHPRAVNPNWKFYESATPASANVLPLSTPAQFDYSTAITKSRPHDTFDLKQALSKIPKVDREKAKKLLTEIEQRPTEINFDSKGTIFLDGESVPGNFFHFLPLLYRKRAPKDLDGFDDFLAKLCSIGLRQFFTLGSKKISIDKELNRQINENKSAKAWWVLV